MDAVDPLCAISLPTRLLPQILGPAPARSPTASPSKASEALLEAIALPLKGSEELVKQAKMVLKEHGDIQMLYHDDRPKTGLHSNGNKEQQGRRPGPDRKRGRKPVPVVDRSKLAKISDPLEYFMTLDRIEEAEKEVKRLNGEHPDEIALNFEPVNEPRRRPGLPGRKSIHSFKLIEDDDTQYPIEVPSSQTGTMTESQLSQDGTHVDMDRNEQSIPSRSSEHAISDVSDSLAAKDDGDELTYLLTSLKNLDESEEEDFFRKTLGIQEIRKEKVSLRNSIPGHRSLRNNAVPKSPTKVRPPERPLPQNCQDRISELEKQLFPGDTVNDKCTDLVEDDEYEGSPDIVMGEPSLMHDSSDVLMTDEDFTASEVDRETPNLGVKATENVLDPEPNIPERADERQSGISPLGLSRDKEVAMDKFACSSNNISTEVPVTPSVRDTEVAMEKFACSSNNISTEEHDVPINYPTIARSNNETEVPSHNLESSSTEVLVTTPGRNMAPEGTDRTSDAVEDKIQRLEVVEGDGDLQDKSSNPLEMPLEDIAPQDQSQMHSVNTTNLEADMINSIAPTKQKKQLAAQKGKRKQQSKRGQKAADESSHPLEAAQGNFDSENQPHTHDVNIEQHTAVMSTALSPNKAKGQKGAKRNKNKNLNRRKSLADAGLAWQSGVRRSTRIRSRPLEHWLGERFLYGRIHDTMATVIGIKAYSPGQDGKKTLKVKSFVPEQYSDVVAESAKY
ncbi:hypothetical protein U9M48_018434 [Paspalum notatum var. saurae]|uniref:Centromere protein C n=1 Tax=Paspalum notatum var. saurae TaxID=547442 RepID=A0AAQ3WQ83_PASNO